MPFNLPVRQSEKDLQQMVVKRLKHLGYTVCEFGKPGGHRALAGAVPEAWPDLLIIHPGGHYTHIELKADGSRLSPAQRALHYKLSQLGCYIITCYGFEQAIEVVESRQKSLDGRTG